MAAHYYSESLVRLDQPDCLLWGRLDGRENEAPLHSVSLSNTALFLLQHG